MEEGKQKKISNRSQCNLAPSEATSTTTESPGYINTPEEHDSDLKPHFMNIVHTFKEGIDYSLKEIQENRVSG